MTDKEKSSSVTESLKSIYHSVELNRLSRSALSEIYALTPNDGKEKISDFFKEIGKLSFFVAKSISTIISVSASLRNTINNGQSVDERIDNAEPFPALERDAKLAKSKKERDDLVSQYTETLNNRYFDMFEESFVVKKQENNFQIKFLKNEPLLKRFCNLMDISNTVVASNLERWIAANPTNSDFQALNAYAQYTLDRISKTLNIDLTKNTPQNAEVPLDFNFDILFKKGKKHKKDDALNVLSEVLPSKYIAKYKRKWSLLVQVQAPDGNLTQPMAQLAALRIAIFPIVNISPEAMSYLTQTEDPTKIRLGLVHAWVRAWLDQCLEEKKKTETPVVSSLLSNYRFSEKKKELGIDIPLSRADEETGLFVGMDGRFRFAPRGDAIDETSVQAYEDLYDELATVSSVNEIPVYFKSTLFGDTNDPVQNKIKEIKTKLKTFGSIPLMSNWDINLCVSIDPETPNRTIPIPLTGGKKPSVLALGEILNESMETGLKYILSEIEGKEQLINFSNGDYVSNLAIKYKLAAIYAFLKVNKLLDSSNDNHLDIDFLLKKSAKAIHNGPVPQDEYEYGIYKKFNPVLQRLISDDCFHFGGENLAVSGEDKKILEKLWYDLPAEVRINRDPTKEELEYTKHYNQFLHFYTAWASLFTIARSAKLREWEAKRQGQKNPDLTRSKYWLDEEDKVKEISKLARNYVVGRAFANLCNIILNYVKQPKNALISYDSNTIRAAFDSPILPNFPYLSKAVVPFLATFGYLTTRTKTILQQAEQEKQKLILDQSQEIPPVPGAKKDFSVFQHQASAIKLLRNKPRVAFLDISPGGGKTVIGLTDCITLMQDGDVRRPLIIAPQNLIKNWVADLNSVITEQKYNTIPITTKTVDKWGEDKMRDLILNAPPNTIFLTDMNFINARSKKIEIRFGSIEKSIYANLEWMKMFNFDYILIDESHYLKNAKGLGGGSIRSKLIAELTLHPSVKYIRLASGTIISNDVDDILGQARLVDPTIFRTESDFLRQFFDSRNGGWYPDVSERIRRRLAKFTGLARAKRKDWAYALPLPKEEHPEKWVVKMDDDFRKVYDYVCNDTWEKIKNDPNLMKKLKGDEENIDKILDEDDEDDAVTGVLQVYLDRLEQFLNAPEADPLNGWEGLDFSKLNAPKIPRLVELLDKHFATEKGKVIVFVRHIASVYGILNRLPPKYRKMAIDYHGSIKENLNKFKFDDDIKILIGVEMSMNTGENLQIASRIIRMELCWSPGELDQAVSRVFRPDFSNKYGRQYIYSDWIICDNSLEIPKVSRLIAKTLNKVQFDEFGSANPEYQKLPYLPPVSVSIKKFLQSPNALRTADQAKQYFDAYADLSKIQFDELITERKKYVDDAGNIIKNPYVKISAAPLPPGSVISPFTPVVPNQNFAPDLTDDGLEPFDAWVMEHKEFENPEKFVEKGTTIYVYTEFGYGYIYSPPRKTKNGYTSVEVNFSYGKRMTVPVDSVYIATNLDKEKVKKYIGINSPKTKGYAGVDPRDVVGFVYLDNQGNLKIYRRREAEEQLQKQNEKGQVSTPENPPVIPTGGTEEDNTFVPPKTPKDNKLVASVMTINDVIFLAFNSNDPDSSALKELGFKKTNPYIGIRIRTLDEYEKTLDFIKKSFNIVDTTGKFEALRKRFNNRTKLFNGEYSNDDMKFLLLDHKPVKNEKNLKLNYLVENHELFLVFDIKSNPRAAAMLINKRPPGVKDKFRKFDSMYLRNFKNKDIVLRALKILNRKVAEITNYNEIVEQINDLVKI